MSQEYNITAAALERNNFRPIHAGDDYTHTFTVERPADTPLDLTGAKLWFTIKRDNTDADSEALLAYSTAEATEMAIVTPASGIFKVTFKHDDTADLAGTWNYDIKALLATPERVRLARGIIEFLPNITQASA